MEDADAIVQPVEGRREFLAACVTTVGKTVCGGALLPTLLGACASVATRPVSPVNGRVELPLARYPELQAAGGYLRILPSGYTDPIYVLSLENREFAALSPICTHNGCTVDIRGPRLVCPCHGSTYDRTGNVLKGPAERALTRLRTFVSNEGTLTIDLGTTP